MLGANLGSLLYGDVSVMTTVLYTAIYCMCYAMLACAFKRQNFQYNQSAKWTKIDKNLSKLIQQEEQRDIVDISLQKYAASGAVAATT